MHVGELEAVLKSLDPNKATGPDEIPARILKKTATTIAPSLCKLFNRSLGEGYIPSEWKLANVVPVYKKDKKIMLKTIGLSPYFALFLKSSNIVS